MIQIFKDKALTRPATGNSPKWMMTPEAGGVKETRLWMGNQAFGVITSTVQPGDSAIPATNLENFPSFGWARAGSQRIHFTGNDGIRLTGIPISGSGAIQYPIQNRSALRCVNQEYSAGQLTIIPEQAAGVQISLKSVAERWTQVDEEKFARLPASFTLPSSALICSMDQLAGEDDLLFCYDFTGDLPTWDLSNNRLDATLQSGTLTRGIAQMLNTVEVRFQNGCYLSIDNLARQFPVSGAIELWVRGTTPLATLFSVNDDVTGAEKFSVRINADSTVRVTQQLASGMVTTFNGSVPVNQSGWNQVVVSWDKYNLNLFLNGALDRASLLKEPFAISDGQCYLGKGSQGTFSGAMCKVRMWNHSVGGDRVATSWNDGHSWMPQENEPVLCFIVKVSADAGPAFQTGFHLLTQGISGYGYDPYLGSAAIAFARRDQGPASQMRVLTPDRQIPNAMPCFQWGEYIWRSDEQSSKEIIPTNWDVDLSAFDESQFTSGISHGDDLKLVGIDKVTDTNSVVPIVQSGEYFIGSERNYFPVKPGLEIINPCTDGPFALWSTPQRITPIFVGRWRSNQVDRYVKDIDCRYVGKKFSVNSDFDTDDTGFQFRLDRPAQQIFLNQKMQDETGYIGIFPSTETEFTFRLPVHPIFQLKRIYISGGSIPTNWEFNQADGTVRVVLDSAVQPLWAGKLVFADFTPGFAVLYETGLPDDTTTITSVELNPVFAGVADGYLYLQHKVWQPKSIQLQVDKPRVPYITSATPEDIQFGPVFPTDFAILTLTAFGSNSDELITGAKFRVQVDKTEFVGSINYRDPLTEDVWVTTGADGSASLVYTPANTYGRYIDLGSISDKTLTLPEQIELDQLYDGSGQYSIHTYAVMGDDPYLGKIDADTAMGEIAFVASGTPGTISYKTNGRRLEWKDTAGNPVFPADLQDENRASYTSAGFSGKVKYIIFTDAIRTGTGIGAYFVAFAGKVTVRLYSPTFNVLSNPITLRVVPPEQITEDSYSDDSLWVPIAGYLTMNDFAQGSGRLNVNRLTGGPLLQLRFSKRI